MSGEWLDLFLATLANNPKRLGGYILEYPKGITQFALQEAEKKLGF
jgi:hypothetical protein